MIIRKPIALLALLVLGSAACADSTDPAARPGDPIVPATSRAGQAAARVVVVHGIDGRDLGLDQALPVDVEVNGACALTAFTFKTITGALALPAGTYDIVVRLPGTAGPCTGAAAITATDIPLESGKRYSIVAHLSPAGAPVASLFETTRGRAGLARVTVRHAAAFGPVDILANGSVLFAGLANGQQRRESIPAGSYAIGVAPAGSGTPALALDLPVAAGGQYFAYAVGTPSRGTFDVVLEVVR